MRTGLLPKIETEMVVSEPLRIGGRTLHPVFKASLLKTEGGMILGCWITPVAIVVVDSGKEYAYSLTGEDVTIDQLMKMASPLRDALDREKGVYRIKIT